MFAHCANTSASVTACMNIIILQIVFDVFPSTAKVMRAWTYTSLQGNARINSGHLETLLGLNLIIIIGPTFIDTLAYKLRLRSVAFTSRYKR